MRVRAPETTADVLEWNVRIAPLVDDESPRGVRRAQRWVAQFVTPDVEGWADWSIDRRADWLDRRLSHKGLLAAKDAIVKAGDIDPEMYDSIRGYFRIFSSGGCECPECKTDTKIDETTLAVVCRYEEIDAHVRRICNDLIRDTKPAPHEVSYWLHRCYQAKSHGMGQGIADKRKEDTKDSRIERSRQRRRKGGSKKMSAINRRRDQKMREKHGH